MKGRDDRAPGTVVVREAEVAADLAAAPVLPHARRLSGWLRLSLGLGAVWVLAYVVLPWLSNASPARPVMEVLGESGAKATDYFYTQSEATALAQMYVRNTLAGAREGGGLRACEGTGPAQTGPSAKY